MTLLRAIVGVQEATGVIKLLVLEGGAVLENAAEYLAIHGADPRLLVQNGGRVGVTGAKDHVFTGLAIVNLAWN